MKKFIFKKFAGLQAYSWQLYQQMNSFTGIFQHRLKPPILPPVLTHAPYQILKSPPPMFSAPVGNPESYFMGRRCLFSLGWPPFYRWCSNKNIRQWGHLVLEMGGGGQPATSWGSRLFWLMSAYQHLQ